MAYVALHADALVAMVAGASVDLRMTLCDFPLSGFLRRCDAALIMSGD